MYLNKHWKTCAKGIDVIINVISANQHFTSTSSMKACVTERLTPRTLDLEVHGSSLVHRVFSLEKELYPTLSLFTQVYKWVQWTQASHPAGSSNTRGVLHAMETGIIKLRLFGPLACVSLYLLQMFKFQRHSCNLSFLFPPRCQSALESFSQATYCLKYDKYQKGLSLYRLHKRNKLRNQTIK